MTITLTEVRAILTRSGGYLRTVTSHSLQPYRGCALGQSLCGEGCYVRANPWVTRGRAWGSFVEVRTNAADAYRRQFTAEQNWGRKHAGRFGIFLSSSTEPFQPAEARYGVTRGVLQAMVERPPDLLIVQTHSHRVLDAADVLVELAGRCEVRVHISIETDREHLPGLPPPASSVQKRMAAGAALRGRGVFTVATVAPLLPIEAPGQFFSDLAERFDAIVIDHFIGGDGSAEGGRTRRTGLPVVMEAVDLQSTQIAYRDAMVGVARGRCARVGVGCDGFAGRYIA